MVELGRKDKLARNLNSMRKMLPGEYNFVPKTWVIPMDLASLRRFYK